VDIDRVSSLPLADFFLPKTDMIFGRKSKPRSHAFTGAPTERTKQWKDGDGVIVELRGNGGQTFFPSSRHHPSGEYVEFDKAGDPASIAWKNLITPWRNSPSQPKSRNGTVPVTVMLLHWR